MNYAGNRIKTTTYDALNRPTSITRPGLAVTSYGLDILGRVVAEKAGAATVRTHVYDTAGRKQSANVTLPRPPTGVTGSAPTVAMSFIYDAGGNRTGATWSGATVGWAYDGLNRVTGVDLGAEAVTRHAYDLLGRRTDTTRGAATSQYSYDIAGQLKGLKHAWSGGSLTAGYLYDDAGALVSEAMDNQAFLWQPATTLAKTTRYDPASPINALTKVDGVAQVHDGRCRPHLAATNHALLRRVADATNLGLMRMAQACDVATYWHNWPGPPAGLSARRIMAAPWPASPPPGTHAICPLGSAMRRCPVRMARNSRRAVRGRSRAPSIRTRGRDSPDQWGAAGNATKKRRSSAMPPLRATMLIL